MPDYFEKFEKMRVAGNLAARTLDMLTDNIKPGVTTDFVDNQALIILIFLSILISFELILH